MTGLVNFPFFHIQFGVGNEWRWHMIGVCWCVRRGSGYWFPSHFPIQNTEKCLNKCRFCTLHIMCRNFLSIFRSHSWRELYAFQSILCDATFFLLFSSIDFLIEFLTLYVLYWNGSFFVSWSSTGAPTTETVCACVQFTSPIMAWIYVPVWQHFVIKLLN